MTMISRQPRERLNANRILICCRKGAALCKRLGRGGPVYFIEPPGVRVKPRYALKAIGSGELVPAPDGLFLDNAQSWRARA